MRFAECGFAGSAAPALDTALTKVPKSLASIVLTTFAGHIGLVFLAGQADNEFASALRLTPRADLALAKAATDAAALFDRWGREGLNLQPADSKSAALRQLSYDPKGAFKACKPRMPQAYLVNVGGGLVAIVALPSRGLNPKT